MKPSETHLRVLQTLEAQPELTQRELAEKLGVSLGRVNYCLRALVDKGWLKMENFQRSESKARYAYLLTPKGIAAKARLTARFLKMKMKEYEALKRDISELKRQLGR
ncbi:MarR family EPS-associated transcriptional regulator [Parahaliea maris]|uniref:MarR family EPS-associated transcriptional regulator n=1 Tax=Parahaliea maris TaxID=2716870 RepID=A0A5C8ZR68_9GAMM|nr:MarR family EPS-associated transcriptional regulator [Parahaliea maris]TXS90845.1 MarR family EPS-associated transcriptional regulator [Parahaliea maris]